MWRTDPEYDWKLPIIRARSRRDSGTFAAMKPWLFLVLAACGVAPDAGYEQLPVLLHGVSLRWRRARNSCITRVGSPVA